VLEEARRWLRTPVRHQHAILGHGVDCWNHIRAVGEACDVLTVRPNAWEPFAAYGEQPSPRLVMGVAETFLRPQPKPRVGDIALIEWRPGLTMHFAILGQYRDRLTLVHAYKPRREVVEHGFVAEWPGLVHSWWRYPRLRGA
jgi:hypothetical protein